jgi:hypothetical protein
MGNLARCHIENDRKIQRIERRDTERYRIRIQFAFRRTRNRNVTRLTTRIDESPEEKASFGHVFGPFTDSTEMGGLPDANRSHAVLGYVFGQEFDGFFTHKLPERVLAIDSGYRTGVSLDNRCGVSIDMSVGNHPIVGRSQPDYAMCVVTPKISGLE